MGPQRVRHDWATFTSLSLSWKHMDAAMPHFLGGSPLSRLPLPTPVGLFLGGGVSMRYWLQMVSALMRSGAVCHHLEDALVVDFPCLLGFEESQHLPVIASGVPQLVRKSPAGICYAGNSNPWPFVCFCFFVLVLCFTLPSSPWQCCHEQC